MEFSCGERAVSRERGFPNGVWEPEEKKLFPLCPDIIHSLKDSLDAITFTTDEDGGFDHGCLDKKGIHDAELFGSADV